MYYEIKTNRLILRPLDISDVKSVHEYASDDENTTYMFHLPNDSIEKIKQFLSNVTNEWKKENPNYYEFAIVYNNTQIGAISIALNDKRTTGEFGWIINKRYWKQGIAIESALAIKDFALNTLKLQKIVANCDCRNISSFNLIKKIGMTLENDTGTRTYPKSNETVQELTYSLTI